MSPFDDHLARIAATVECFEAEPIKVDLSPVYAEHDEAVRASRRQSLQDARAQMDSQLAILNGIATKIQSVLQEIKQRREWTISANAPIEILPSDILGDIFTYVVARAGRTRLRTMAIAQVTSRWRRIALQRSSIWSKLVVHERLPTIAKRDYKAFVAEWVRRSGNAPLDIMVQAQYLGLLKKLEIPGSRIRSLSIIDWKKRDDLSVYPDHPDYVQNMSLPSLEVLRLVDRHVFGYGVDGMDTFDLPKLHTLVAVGPCVLFVPQLITAYGAQLRNLSIMEDISPSVLRFFLQSLPSLETLYLKTYKTPIGYPASMDTVVLDEVCEMKALVRLVVHHCSPELVMTLDRHYQFPNLRSFYILVRDIDSQVERLEKHRDLLAGIIQRCTFLEELAIDGSRDTVCDLLSALFSTLAKEPFDTAVSSNSFVPSILPSSLETLSLLALGAPDDHLPTQDFMHKFLSTILEPSPQQLPIVSSHSPIADSPSTETHETPKYRCCVDESGSDPRPKTVVLPCLITNLRFLQHHLGWYEQRVGRIEGPDHRHVNLDLIYEGLDFRTEYITY